MAGVSGILEGVMSKTNLGLVQKPASIFVCSFFFIFIQFYVSTFVYTYMYICICLHMISIFMYNQTIPMLSWSMAIVKMSTFDHTTHNECT